MELHPLEPDLGQEWPPRAHSAFRTFHPVPDWMAFPEDTVGMGVLEPVLLQAHLLGSPVQLHVGDLGACRENSWEKGPGRARLCFQEGPGDASGAGGMGGSLCFCLLWITACFGPQYSGGGMGDAGVAAGAGVVVVGGLWGFQQRGGHGVLCWGLLGVSVCSPRCDRAGIHGLGPSFGRRQPWELPWLHPKGNRIF